jgi:predicted DCC family thiol-disulfide oxidoreductase YuxK
MSPPSEDHLRTTPPEDGTPVVLFDGGCVFCTRQAERLERLAGGRIRLRSFRDPGVLGDYPGVTGEACMKEMKLIAPDGRVFGGAEAFVRAVGHSRPVIGKLLLTYYIPGLRKIADALYDAVARRRYAIAGGSPDTTPCPRHGPHDS